LVVDQPSTKEWIASHDPWFRPVDIMEGPGGEIYIVDRYRAVIEHPDWVPKELKERPDQRYGDQHGRIYRVVRSDKSKTDSISRHSLSNSPDITGSPVIPDITGWIRHSDSWNRSIGARMFLERMSDIQDTSLLKSVRDIVLDAGSTTSNGAVATAAFLLGAVDALDEDLVSGLLGSENAERREIGWHALRESSKVWGRRWDSAVIQTIDDLASTREELRSAMWFFASQRADSDLNDSMDVSVSVAEASAKALMRHGDDLQLWMAAAAANRKELERLLEQYRLAMVGSPDAILGGPSREAVVRLAGRVATQSFESSNRGWLALCEEGLRVPANVQVRRLYFAILEGFFGGGKLAIGLESEIENFADIVRKAKVSKT
jgi:hypothetical protein